MGDKSAVKNGVCLKLGNWKKLGPQAVAIFSGKQGGKPWVATFYGVMSEGTSRAHGLSMIIIFHPRGNFHSRTGEPVHSLNEILNVLEF